MLRARRHVQLFARGMALLLALLWVRVAAVQLGMTEIATSRFTQQSSKSIERLGRRGAVLDRHGRRLAVSLLEVQPIAYWRNVHQYRRDGEWVDRDPSDVEETIESLVALLSPQLDVPAQELTALLRTRGWVPLCEPTTDPDVIDFLDEHRRAERGRRAPLARLDFEWNWRRAHPWGSVGHNLVGWVDDAGRGGGGVEATLDAVLASEDGVDVQRWDGFKGLFDVDARDAGVAPVHGDDVTLTIDVRIQSIIEHALADAMADTNATAAMGAMIDVRTGDVLALASLPSLDPASTADRVADPARVGAVQTRYPPGSTMKPLMLATALDLGLVAPDERIDTHGGRRNFGSRRVTDSGPKRDAPLSLEEVLVDSSNVAMASIMTRLVPADARGAAARQAMAPVRDQLGLLGFGRETGIPVGGEASGLVRDLDDWTRNYTLVSLSFGYEIAVTALQMAVATSALADGTLPVQPRLLAQVTSQDGEVHAVPRPERRRVFAADTADRVRDWMVSVVDHKASRQRNLRVPGVSVAGKTGTASIETDHDREAHSFVALAPAEEPIVSLAVVLVDPQGVRYSTQSAAPAAARILRGTLPYLGVDVEAP